MPAATASAGERSRTGCPSSSSRPACRGRRAAQRLEQLAASGADQATEAEDLAGAHLEADVVDRPAAHPVRREHDGAGMVGDGGSGGRAAARGR